MANIIFAELCGIIVGAFYDVYNTLGPDLPEKLLQNALCVALQKVGVPYAREVRYTVRYQGVDVGTFRADLVIADSIVVEIKCAEKINKEHIRQVLYYLKASNLSLGIILNFGTTPSFRRVIR
jgi:GxxExxY protein